MCFPILLPANNIVKQVSGNKSSKFWQAGMKKSRVSRRIASEWVNSPLRMGQNTEEIRNFCILFWFVVRQKALSGVGWSCLSLVSAVCEGCYGILCFTRPDFWRTIEA